VKDAEQVDVQHPLDRLRVDLEHRPVAGDPGVGQHGVNATEVFDGLGGRGLHRGQVAHIGNDGQCPALAEFGGERGQLGRAEIDQHEFGALVAQPAGDLGPDSPCPTGDEDHFAVQ
jgi:hypothetical protein